MPQPSILYRLEDIPEGASRGFKTDPGAYYADILIIRKHGQVYAYRNHCPHTGAPMEWQPDQFLDYKSQYIQCGIHGALFRIEDGYCIAGPCQRRTLEKIAVQVQDGLIITLPDFEPDNG